MVSSRVFIDYDRLLKKVTFFKYMRRVLLVANDYWPAVVLNLVKARTVWWRMLRILSMDGVIPRVQIFLFKSVAQ